MNVCVCVVCCADPLTALHRSQELNALHKAGACNKFLEMCISSNGSLGVGGDLSTPLFRWRTGRLPALFDELGHTVSPGPCVGAGEIAGALSG